MAVEDRKYEQILEVVASDDFRYGFIAALGTDS
jgi:negative regulator of sigma E activity